LEEPVHAAQAVEKRAGETAVAEQVVVEKVGMAAGQPRDLGERVVDALSIEGTAAGKESVVAAEIAMLRAAASDRQRVRHEIVAAPDQVAAQGAARGSRVRPAVEA
jgi:hypothetical protein